MTNTDLSFILPELETILDGLINLSYEKQSALVANDIPSLENALLHETKLVETLESVGRNHNGLEFSRLPYDHPLKTKILKLRELNIVTQRLINTALRLVQYNLKLFIPQESGYWGNKALESPLKFDRKV